MTHPPSSWVPNEVQRRSGWQGSVALHPEGTAHSVASYAHDKLNEECIKSFDVIHSSADAVNKACSWCGQSVHVTSRKVLRVIDGMWQDMSVLPPKS